MQMLPLAIMAAGAVVQNAGQNRMRSEQRDILNRQLARTNATQDTTTNQILGEAKNYAPAQRMDALQQQEGGIFAQSQKDLAGSSAGTIPTAGDAGNVSSDFLRAKADRTLSEGNRLTAIARELSKIHAPGQLMTGEGIRRAGVQGDVAGQWGATRRLGEAGQLDASQVQEPWWSQVAGIVGKGTSAYAGGMMGGR